MSTDSLARKWFRFLHDGTHSGSATRFLLLRNSIFDPLKTLIAQLPIPLMIIGLSGPSIRKQENTRRVSFPSNISSTRRFSHAGSFKNENDETDTSEDSKGFMCF